MREKDVLLFSGGLDSLIAWYYLDYPTCLYVDLGHRYSVKEKLVTQTLAKNLGMKLIIDKRLNLADKEEPDAYIPMRNSFLAHVGALYGDRVWIIAQKGELDLPDRSPKFFNQITNLLQYLNRNPKISVNSPFFSHTKTDMVAWYVKNQLPVENLLLSTSCYKGTNCGTCSACFRRWVSLELNGIEEQYAADPWDSPLAQEYLDKVKQGLYEPTRAKEIIMALNKRGLN